MSAQIFYLSPKGSAWLVYHRAWKGGGSTTNWAFVFDYTKGLTAYEAWSKANLAGGPPFYEVITEQLEAFTGQGGASASTKDLTKRAQSAYEVLRERIRNNPKAV